MPIETELKLQLDPRHIARLRDHPLIKRATQTESRKLYNIYYDTPDLNLWRAGIGLRLRRAGTRWIQTIKTGGDVAAGMHRRNEFEAEVAGKFPDFSLMEGEFTAQFADPELRARLQPLIVTEFTRISCLLRPARGTVIEASIDQGSITSGDESEPLCELELEVKTGPPWRAYQAALQLLESVPLLVEDRSKAERGISLYLHREYLPRKAQPSPVTADMTCNDAFKALVQTCLAHYVANQRGVLENADPEYLHQARVALRRLRSVFNTFSPLLPAPALAAMSADTRWFSHELGRARDWDVFADETLAPVSARHRGKPGMAVLARSVLRLRMAANSEVRREVASARGQALLLSLGGWLSAESWIERLNAAQRGKLQEPVAGFAQTVFDAASRRVSKRGRNIDSLGPRELHSLRIAVKKLRYAGDFFAALYPRKRSKPYLARLAGLQEVLGIINDTAATPRLLAAFEAPGTVPRAALDLVADWNTAIHARELKRLARAWPQFKRAKTFW